MSQIKKDAVIGFQRKKIGLNLIFSYILFLLCMSLDFYMTIVGSNGDWTMEGNAIAQMWWQIMGPYRFIEIPIWALFVFFMAYVAYPKHTFLSLLWLNTFSFNHFFGFITWLPTNTSLYHLYINSSMYPTGLLSVCAGLLLTIIQVYGLSLSHSKPS